MAVDFKFTLVVFVLAFVGIFPYCNPKNRRFTNNAFGRGIWLVIDVLLLILIIKDAVLDKSDSNKYVFYGGPLFTVVLHIIFVYTICFRKHLAIQNLLDSSQKIDKSLAVFNKHRHTQFFTEITFVGNTIIVIFIMSFQTPTQLEKIDSWGYFVGFELFHCFAIFLGSWTTFSILNWIRDKLKLLNSWVRFNSSECPKIFSQKIDLSLQLYVDICDFTATFNHIFGWFLLCSFFIGVGFTLLLIMSARSIEGDVPFSYVINDVITVFVLAQTVTIAWKAEGIRNESLELLANCHRAIVPLKHEKLANNILLLIQLVSTRPPVVSAMGFFNYNHAMLHMFIGTIVTYAIVLLQANS